MMRTTLDTRAKISVGPESEDGVRIEAHPLASLRIMGFMAAYLMLNGAFSVLAHDSKLSKTYLISFSIAPSSALGGKDKLCEQKRESNDVTGRTGHFPKEDEPNQRKEHC